MVDASKDRVVQLHISTGVHTGSSPVLTTNSLLGQRSV